MLSSADVVVELNQLLATGGGPLALVSIYEDGYIPDAPHEIIVVTVMPGRRIVLDGAAAECVAQIHFRGAPVNPNAPNNTVINIASTVDNFLTNECPYPTMFGDTRVIWGQNLSGPPGFWRRDNSHRTLYSGNYLFLVAR